MEKSYVMIKPGFLHLEKEIIKRLGDINCRVLETKKMNLNERILKEHYSHLANMPFFPEIVNYMTSGEVKGMIVEGPNGSISEIRKIVGPTKNAPKGTIRGDYALDGSKNVIHASDAVETANSEIKRFFERFHEFK